MARKNQDKDGVNIKSHSYKDRIMFLTDENRALKARIEEMSHTIDNVQTCNDYLKSQVSDLMEECEAECRCVVLEGTNCSAAYQDFVGILLANGYGAELVPVDQGRRLKITIKEREV
jgi:hypothetical protein